MQELLLYVVGSNTCLLLIIHVHGSMRASLVL